MMPFCLQLLSGKMKLSKLLQKSFDDLREVVQTFYDATANADSVASAGEVVIKALYGSPRLDIDLDVYRYECFLKCVAGNRAQLSSLPPTIAAARQYSLRVYHQVQTWLGNVLKASQLGWHETEDGLQPVETTLQPAPAEILKLISCGCKKSCGAACGCRRAGLVCSSVCTTCRGTSCLNINITTAESESEVSDIDDTDLLTTDLL